jgi:Oxidoreductase-like protein, N-terminal.
MNLPDKYNGPVLPPRPEEPLPGECCGRGCEYCVYVYYEEAIRRWEEKVALLMAEHQSKAGGADHSNGLNKV